MFRNRLARTLFVIMLVFALWISVLPAAPRPVYAASADIVISQVYGGGGNTGATYKNDFIELFNRGTAAVDVSTWSVQYASSAGSSWQKTNLSGTIQPGQYYLVQEAKGSGGSVDLPTPDATGSIAMSSSSGKVALVTNQTALTCGGSPGNCFPNAAIRDFVGFGTAANNYEGSGPTANLSNSTAALRNSLGCTDTDNNAADFTVSAPNPRNSASAVHYCSGPTDPTGVGAADPASIDAGDSSLLTVAVTPGTLPTSTGLAVSADLSAIGGAAAQPFYDDATNGDLTAGDNVFSFLATVPTSVSAGSKTLPAAITDAEGRSGSASIALEVKPPFVAIPAIQGSGLESPLAGSAVKTSGVVTVILGNGLFLQDPAGDGDPATSDGIFVYSSQAKNYSPGDLLTVTGTVSEYRSSSNPRDLTLTEISGKSLVKTGTADLPAPVLLSDLPDESIPDGIAFYESLEGMYVEIALPKVVGPTNSYGEFVTVAAGDASHTTTGGNILTHSLGGDQVDYNPERIMVDDEARVGGGSTVRINNPQVDVVAGDQASGNITGALDYQYSNYRVQASQPVSNVLTGSTPASPVANLRTAQPFEGRIATFNLENLFDCVNDPDKDDTASCNAAALAALETKVAKLAAVFQDELHSPEIVSVEEAENTEVLTGDANGYIPGTTILALLPRLPGNWQAASVNSSDVRGIEVAFIYNADRVTLHNYFLSTDILPDTGGIFNGSVYRAGREPLVGLFTLDDVDVIVIGNHFKSKGGSQYNGDPTAEPGDDPLYGVAQPAVRWTETLRHMQADYVRALVDLLLAQHPGARVAVEGDLNDLSFAEPAEGVDTLARIKDSATDPMVDVTDLVPEDSRFTYVFEGNSQVLDHLLVNGSLQAILRDQVIGHINASFPDKFLDDPSVTYRTSDHDPVVAYFCTDATAPTLSVSVTPTQLWPPNHKYVTVTATVSAADNADPDPQISLVSVTSSEPDDGQGDGDTPDDIVIVDQGTFKLRAERSGSGSGRVYTITYQVTDACGNQTTASATVTVPHNKKK